MRKFTILLFLMLSGMPGLLQAQSDAARKLQQRQAALYYTDSLEAFMDVSDRLKKVLEKEGEEEQLYNAWNRQITYVLDNVGTDEALKMIDEVRAYADEKNSKYGFYILTFLNAHIAKDLGMNDRAEELVEQAIDYKKRYLHKTKPMLQLYYFMANVYGEKKQGGKFIQEVDKALQQKGWNEEDIIVLWSLKCNAVTNMEPVDTARFMKYYEQLHAVIKKKRYVGDAAIKTECFHAQFKHDYPRLLALTQKITDKGLRLRFKITAYDGLKREQEALDSFKVYKEWTDQQFNAETRKQAEMSALALESARAENEAETLRLTNQRMILTIIVWGLGILAIYLMIFLRRRHRQMLKLQTAYDQLEEVTSQKERIESELRIARDIQMSMVPTDFIVHPDTDIYASMTPAKAVGGDLYDFYISDGQLYFCIGDVSGKGVPASLFMSVTKSLFRAYSSEEKTPDRIVARMNKSQSEDNRSCMFVTLFVGILDLTSGELRYCNAGHEAPFIIEREGGAGEREHGGARQLPVNHTFPVGAIRDTAYQTQTTVIQPQSTILLYTDGLSEAMNGDNKMYGLPRITDELEQAIPANQTAPKALIGRLLQSVHSFVGDTEQSDDITLLAISLRKQPNFSYLCT